MSRSEELASRFERTCHEFADYLEGLTAEQWQTRAVNSPDVTRGEDEHRPVAVVAHHVGDAIPLMTELARRLSAAEAPPPITFADVDAGNVKHAAANPHPDQASTIELIRDNATDAAAQLRELAEETLERSGETYVGRLSCEQFIRRALIGHVRWHEGSIRATFGTAPDRADRNGGPPATSS